MMELGIIVGLLILSFELWLVYGTKFLDKWYEEHKDD